VFALLAFGIITGMLATLTNIGDAVHYRESTAPYFRQLFVFDPEPGLMTGDDVTLIFQLHVVGVWFLYMLWPFSRLVHAFSVPVAYLKRRPIVYRPRTVRSIPGRRPDTRPGR
jgi:nitrate reductase gamma subunit